MYADRYQPTSSRSAGAGAALLINGAIILGLLYAGPKIVPREIATVLTGRNIELPRPEITPEPKPTTRERETVRTTPQPHVPDRLVKLPTASPPIGTTPEINPLPIAPPGPVGPLTGGGGVTVDPPHKPVLVGASIDPRHADALQPPYPASELRAGTEGNLSARVLIGVDGRVKAIEILRSPSDGLSAATRRHALARWRFKPATRDGIPVESWKVMTLRFQIVE